MTEEMCLQMYIDDIDVTFSARVFQS